MVIHPFDNVIVSEPRRIEKPVEGLNDQPLQQLVNQFESLEGENIPRTRKFGAALFVMSPEPGYGKSHLIGRLFRALQGRATLVYLRPFTNPASCWKSILLKTVQEMEFPESGETEFCGEGEITQLEGLAHGILKRLMLQGLESGKLTARDKGVQLKHFRKVPVQELRNHDEWRNWLRSGTSSLASLLDMHLRRAGARLNSAPGSWLGVLSAYAYNPDDYDVRQACLDWLRGGSVEEEQANLIRIARADQTAAELALNELNEICKERIMDLCCLAGFYRPFLLCFDQTETYALDPLNARTFGLVIQALADDFFNQMTVITANQVPWFRTIHPHWQEAHTHRLKRPYIELESLTRQQAEELLNHRLEGWDLPKNKAAGIADERWIHELFSVKSSWGVRQFLYECGKRWKEMAGRVARDPEPEEQDPERLFQGYLQKISAQPKRLVFDQDILFWLVREVAKDLPGVAVEEYKSRKGYFVLRWKAPGGQVYFGFEPGSTWSRWNAINREAARLCEGAPGIKTLLFRTPELKEIPSPTWTCAPELQKGRARYLHILHLAKREIAEIYGSYDLFSDAAEGNIPLDRQAVLALIRKRLSSFWARILEMRPANWGTPEEASSTAGTEGPKKISLIN
jgi:hypothetical protein